MNFKNYIITHKKFDVPQIPQYIPLQVGDGGYLGYDRDNVGENICEKNKNYCELTGMYWIWKNDKDVEVVGISHYRRYFTKSFFSFKTKYFLNSSDVSKLLEKYDCIVSKPLYFHINLEQQYIKTCGFAKDLRELRKVIQDFYVDYLENYDDVMEKKYLYPYNMVLIEKKEFDEYCKWLFSILFELERRIDISKYTDYEKRIFGFMSERLFNVWIEKKRYKLKCMRVVNPYMSSEEKRELIINKIKTGIKNLYYNVRGEK